MSKFVDNKIVRFLEFTDLSGNPIDDWHDEYLYSSGMLYIYESEHKYPGKKFIYYYPNEPESDMQRYCNSVTGDLSMDENLVILEDKDNHRYVFEEGHFITNDDAALLWLNINIRWKS